MGVYVAKAPVWSIKFGIDARNESLVLGKGAIRMAKGRWVPWYNIAELVRAVSVQEQYYKWPPAVVVLEP